MEPGRFRTDAGKPDFQTCYLGNDKQIYNVFISRRLKEENFNNRIYFKIDRIKSKTNNEKTLKMVYQMLDQLNQNMNLSFMNQNPKEKLMVGLADLEVLDQNFCMGNNVDQNKNHQKKKRSTVQEKLRREFFKEYTL